MKIVLVGGTGIIGSECQRVLREQGMEVTAIGTARSDSRVVDPERMESLTRERFDAVIDIWSYDQRHAERVRSIFGNTRYVVMSTTLVYDRTRLSHERIDETHRIAEIGTQGAYVDKKLAVESFWKASRAAYTLLRPYHILGRGSHLGCAPMHNRDSLLLQRMKDRQPLALVDGGRNPLNVVSPKDIARAVSAVLKHDEATKRGTYNITNPREVLVREYYEEIARQATLPLSIIPVNGEKVWQHASGWNITSLPHLYSTARLQQDTGFTPRIPLEKCVSDAMNHEGERNSAVHQRMTQSPEWANHRAYHTTFDRPR